MRLQKHNDYIKIYLTFFYFIQMCLLQIYFIFSIYLLQREMKKKL